MEDIFFIAVLFILTGCSQQEAPKTIALEALPKSNYSKIQHIFKDISPDSLYVYSDWSVERNDFAFKGTPMDSAQFALLPRGWMDHYSWNKDFAGCVKFPLDSTKMALIARVSGEYVSSALKLFVFDLQKDSIVNTISLADVWGDAGESSVYNSCLFKDKNKDLLIVTYNSGSYDHRVGQVENDTIIEKWNYYYIYKLSNNILDTLSKDSSDVVNRYPTIIDKLRKL
jgi:hypothetical protein